MEILVLLRVCFCKSEMLFAKKLLIRVFCLGQMSIMKVSDKSFAIG